MSETKSFQRPSPGKLRRSFGPDQVATASLLESQRSRRSGLGRQFWAAVPSKVSYFRHPLSLNESTLASFTAW